MSPAELSLFLDIGDVPASVFYERERGNDALLSAVAAAAVRFLGKAASPPVHPVR